MEGITIIYNFEKIMEIVICKVVQTLIGIQAFWYLPKTKVEKYLNVNCCNFDTFERCKLIECLQIFQLVSLRFFYLIGTTIYL
jgi:hypothetical protein